MNNDQKLSLIKTIPSDILTEIAVLSDRKTCRELYLTCKTINNILSVESFYKLKFIYEYGYTPTNITSWKKLYFTYGLYNLSHGTPVIVKGVNPLRIMHLSTDIYIKSANDKCIRLSQDNKRNVGYVDNKPQYGKIKKIYSKMSGSSYHLILLRNNKIYGLGINNWSQMGNNPSNTDKPKLITDLKIKKVSSKDTHTLCIDIDSNVWVFGSNNFGRLGLGKNDQDELVDSVEVPTMIPNIKAKKIYTYSSVSYIIDLENNIWVAGYSCNKSFYTKFTNLTNIYNIKASKIIIKDTITFIIDLDNKPKCFDTQSGNFINMGHKTKQIISTCYGSYYVGLDDNKLYMYTSIYQPFTGFRVKQAISSNCTAICIGYYQ